MGGFPRGAFTACEGGGLEELLPASLGVFRVFFLGVGLGRNEDTVCPVEDPPLGVRFEDADGRLLGGRVQGVSRRDGQFYPGGVEVWGGPAAWELIDVERGDGVMGACGGGGIAGMAVGSQWCSWAARVYREAVMMWWACPSRTMWRSLPKSFGRWAVGWTVMWARARWWPFFLSVWRLRPFVPRDVLVLVVWWGRSKGERLYSVQGDGVFPGPVGQHVYARVPRYGVQVHVARDGGGRERLAQGRGAWGGAGRVMVLTLEVVDAVQPDVYGEGSDGALEFVGLDVVEARHRPGVGAPFADPHGVCR